MHTDCSIRRTDGRVIASMAVAFVALTVLFGLSAPEDIPIDSNVALHVASPAATTADERLPARPEPHVVPFEETWSADESARGQRPDATH